MNDTGKSAKLAKYDRLYEQIKGYIHTTEDRVLISDHGSCFAP